MLRPSFPSVCGLVSFFDYRARHPTTASSKRDSRALVENWAVCQREYDLTPPFTLHRESAAIGNRVWKFSVASRSRWLA